MSDADMWDPTLWNREDPPKHGYYLAAWAAGGSVMVSELWFNPTASPKWWTSRRYIGEPLSLRGDAIKQGVIAWMPMPPPPER
jgi:hypothetical protein